MLMKLEICKGGEICIAKNVGRKIKMMLGSVQNAAVI